jgi:hypothetical protein
MALLGDVRALVEVGSSGQGNLAVLAGTNNAARIYRSTDQGINWTQIAAIGSSNDAVNALAYNPTSSILMAAVTGSTSAQGIWRSTNLGTSWTKVKSHPNNLGYSDIVYSLGVFIAVGPGTTTDVNGPVVWSNDNGFSWNTAYTPHYSHPHMSIASWYDNSIFGYNLYPGEPAEYNFIYAFYGTNTYYTQAGGVRGLGSNFLVVPINNVGGGMGNGGLDMAAFLYNHTSGSKYRKALWAVKSHLNTANTEIWQWPSTPTSFQWAKIATVAGVNFTVLYVDKTPNDTNAHRTIWAGANGTIWVSYNSGLSWAIATTAPNGIIYSFVRTKNNTLIAGAASGEIFIFGGTGGEGGGTPPPPVDDGRDDDEEDPTTPPEEPEDPEDPTQPAVATSRFLGRLATCENEVFVSNKFSFSNVTHVFHFNGSTFSNLQFSTVPPYSLLGTSAATNKATYFGSQTTATDVPGGTFSSLVFDITQVAENITVVWEYWNGSTWTTLTVQDNTDQFRLLGVNSVSWEIPSAWATTSVNSVIGYWIRARISSVSANSVTPTQNNRFIYTTLLPYIDISKRQVLGDLPSLGRLKWSNQAGMDIERSICGLRSVDRGANFNAYINISDVQTQFGMTVTKGTEAGVAWQDSKKAPTGRSLIASYSSSGDLNDWNNLVSIRLDTSIARDYYGHYRVFVRCFYNNASAKAWNLRIQLLFGSGGSQSLSQTAYPTTLSDWETVDLGHIAIPTTQIAYQAGNLGDELKLVVQGLCNATSKPLTLYDLVLIPIDEWAVDAIVPDLASVGAPEVVTNNYVDIDSISNPKVAIAALNRNPAGQIISRYQTVNNGPVILQKNRDQRIWFLNLAYEDYWKSYPETIGSVQVYKQQQYLGFRGTN